MISADAAANIFLWRWSVLWTVTDSLCAILSDAMLFLQVKFAGDRCCVCDSDVDFDVDRLVSCDGCGITVHQSCYGIPELPDEDDMWLCR